MINADQQRLYDLGYAQELGRLLSGCSGLAFSFESLAYRKLRGNKVRMSSFQRLLTRGSPFRTKAVGAVAVSMVLVVVGLGGSASATATGSAAGDSVTAIQQAWAYVPEYTAAPAIESGLVTDHAGHPVAGATVILFPLLRNPKKGTVVPPLARTVTGANGRYVLHLPTALDSSLANKWTRGALNLHIMVFYPNASGSWFVPIPAGQHATASAASITLRAVAETYVSDLPDDAPPNGSCDAASSPKSIGPVAQIVGYKSSLDPKLISAEFSYSTGYSVTTGGGLSYSGTYGSVSGDGTTTTSDTETIVYKPLPGAGSNYYEADSVWTWQKFQCFHPGGHGGGYWTNEWYLYENAVGGSRGTPGAPAVKAGYCYSSTDLESVTEDRSTEKTWAQGADLKALGVDVNLSSQDGYTTDASLTYNFNVKARDYPPYCGVGGYPGTQSAGYVQVHK